MGLFFFGFLLAGPCFFVSQLQAQEKPPAPKKESVYRIVPAQKSLASSPQFILIDDFKAKTLKNLRGGIWHLRNAPPRSMQVSLPREDARNPQKNGGSSLKLNFNLPQGKEAVLKSSLDKLDVSQADAVVFSCKTFSVSRARFPSAIRFVMQDWKGRQSVIDLTAACGEGQWSEVILPKERFAGLDWDQLSSISFQITAGKQPSKGFFQIDEIAFYGANEVFFESHLDNLKGFPKTIFAEKRREELLKIKDDKLFLRAVAADTWKYFENAQNSGNLLIVDHIRVGDAPLASDYTSPTNIGLDLMSIVAAEKMKIITWDFAVTSLRKKLEQIENMRRWKNLYYNYYETTKLSVTNGFLSSVDNGWLAIALVVVRQALDRELYREATKILNRMDFGEFLDYENNQLSLGFDSEKNELVQTHYGLVISEARATSLFGIGKGDLPEDHWWSLYRTPPDSWKWQTQKPKGHQIDRDGLHYFQGYYQYGDLKIVPSWGGSLFEFLMPTLVLDEKNQAKKSFGMNNFNAVQAQKDYALKKQGYPIWGLSPAATTNGRTWKYGEYGVKALGVKGYPDQGVITPHVSFLAINVAPQDALRNIRKMLEFKIYGEYGFYDSIQIKTSKVNTQYLALDQGMSFLAMANFLEDNYIQKLFQQDPIGQKAAALWEKEAFFE